MDLRNMVGSVLRKRGLKKSERTMVLIGCSVDEFREHIESQFQDGMTWDNHGVNGWHIDHVVPCAAFDLTDQEQQRVCFHFTNLQPLWAIDNLRKKDKIAAQTA